jgi:hypothetical protein
MHKKFFEQLRNFENHMQNSVGMQKKCSVNDTACTIDERFERPWQPLKGIAIKNIYVPELSYPTTKKYIHLKLSFNTYIPTFLRSKIDHISADSKQNSKRLYLARESGAQGILFDEKNRGSKIS